MHAQTDSEVTSYTASSPTRSPPRRPVYYVQSPSRESSHDGEKTTLSLRSTPPVLSPMGSPPHSQSSIGRHSRESSTSRYSGTRKISPNDGSAARKGGAVPKEWVAIEEEGLLDDGQSQQGMGSRRFYFLAFIGGFFLLFAVFSLILWGASRPQKPKITMKSIKFERFAIQAGSDHSGVATEMLSMNSTVRLTFRNTATFFGVHVSATPLEVSFSQLTLASGTMKKFYQARKSQRSVSVTVMGNRVPLYGSVASMSSSAGTATVPAPVPLKLNFLIRSRAYVLGKLVKPKFYEVIRCSLVLNTKKINTPISLRNSCTHE